MYRRAEFAVSLDRSRLSPAVERPMRGQAASSERTRRSSRTDRCPGPGGFYGGEVAEKICRSLRAEGGLLTEEDLQAPVAQWLDPLSSGYRDYLVYEQPPVSQGFMVLEMLNIVEAWPMNDGQVESGRRYSLPGRGEETGLRRSYPAPRGPGLRRSQDCFADFQRVRGQTPRTHRQQHHARQSAAVPLGSDTTYLCAADGDGNAISLIQSVFAPFGSRVIAGETGVILNNRLCSFGLDPGKANALEPGKRPAHTLNTYMVFRGKEFFAAGGSPGADDQPQTNLQVLHNILDLGMNPQLAVEAPRWSHQPGTPPRDKLPEELRMEAGFDPQVISDLRKKGHKISLVDRWSFGSAKVIIRDRDTGTWMAGADPRREAYALGF